MPLWVLALVACQDTLVTSAGDLGPYLVLSGRLDSRLLDDPTLDPAALDGGIAWLVIDGDELGVEWQPAALEPRLLGYAMEIAGPPDIDQVVPVGPAPPELRMAGARVAIGLPALHTGDPPPVSGDGLLTWSLGTAPDPSLPFGSPSTVRAAATGHVLGVVSAGPDVTVLAEQPGFVDEPPWCRWAQLQPGLVLYRDDGPSCDGWRSIAYAQEYQGVDMVDVTLDAGSG